MERPGLQAALRMIRRGRANTKEIEMRRLKLKECRLRWNFIGRSQPGLPTMVRQMVSMEIRIEEPSHRFIKARRIQSE